MIAADIAITQRIHYYLLQLIVLEVDLELCLALNESTLGGKHLVILLVANDHPPEFLLLPRIAAANYQIILQLLLALHCDPELHLLIVSSSQLASHCDFWVSVPGSHNLIHVLALQQFLSFFIIEI